MATSAFKSTTKRTPVPSPSTAEDACSSNGSGDHRRSKSLSRYSGRFAPPEPENDRSTLRSRFVNTVRGSGFPEISLDDLADEFFVPKQVEEGRSVSSGERSQRRGRSVSRSHGKGNFDNNLGGKGFSESNYSRRRRSVSVALYPPIDSEGDMDHSHNWSNSEKSKTLNTITCQRTSLYKPTAPNQRGGLRRPLSQLDLLQSNDGYSSHSSAVSDDEAHYACNRNGLEKTIRAVYSQNKSEDPIGDRASISLFEAMRKEVRHAVEEIRTELGQVMVKSNPVKLTSEDSFQSDTSGVVQAIGEIRKSYTSKLEQSEKRKLDLLAELTVEEQRNRDISKIVRELPPEPKHPTPPELSQARKKSNDKARVSRRLIEEAEKYFDDFLSNVEDTDFSSIDGERSDVSSTVGGSTRTKEPVIDLRSETVSTPERIAYLPVDMDGFVFPLWQQETKSNNIPLSWKSLEVQETWKAYSISHTFDSNLGSCSSNCNWSSTAISGNKNTDRDTEGCSYPQDQAAQGLKNASSFNMDLSSPAISGSKTDGGHTEGGSCPIQQAAGGVRMFSSFSVNEYMRLQGAEDLLFERLKQRNRIDSGGLILCGTTHF